jgi:hypothetical protein
LPWSHSLPHFNTLTPTVFGTKYKKVEKHTFPVSTTTPEEFCIERRCTPDPLAGLTPLFQVAPPFSPGLCYTAERMQGQAIDSAGFLLPDGICLAHWILLENKNALAWHESEKGSFSSECFDPILIPTIKHIPWIVKNIPITPGICAEVIKIIKDKIGASTYSEGQNCSSV